MFIQEKFPWGFYPMLLY